MTATSKQEPHTPTAAPEHAAPEAAVIREVVADDVVADAGAGAGDAMSEPSPVKRAAVKKIGSDGAEAKPGKPPLQPNNVRKLRQAAMMSKAELARRAGVSPLTIDRVESGCPCRMDTKRKILEALGLKPEAREQVFGPDIDQG